MRLRWSEQASTDVDEIQFYIGRESFDAAVRIGDLIARAGERLREHPRSGRPGAVTGTRELAIARTRYLLIYRVEDDGVEVLRVMGAGRQWPPEEEG